MARAKATLSKRKASVFARREQAATIAGWDRVVVVDLDPEGAATRGVLLENETIQVQGLEFLHPLLRPALHRFGVIGPRLRCHHARVSPVADQAEVFSRHTHADFDRIWRELSDG